MKPYLLVKTVFTNNSGVTHLLWTLLQVLKVNFYNFKVDKFKTYGSRPIKLLIRNAPTPTIAYYETLEHIMGRHGGQHPRSPSLGASESNKALQKRQCPQDSKLMLFYDNKWHLTTQERKKLYRCTTALTYCWPNYWSVL